MVVIMSININGLQCVNKLEQLCVTLETMHTDIAIIQETHWDNNFFEKYKHKYNGKIYASNYIAGSRGCAVFVQNKYKECVEYQEYDDNGRYMQIKIRLNNKLFVVHNIYASNNIKERKLFFNFLKLKIKPEETNIIGGDFNTWLTKMDISNNMSWLPDNSRVSLSECMSSNNIQDIWRRRNKSTQIFSRHQMVLGKMKQSHIDMFFVSNNIASDVINVYYKPTKISDHDFVLLNLNVHTTERGPGLWVFNNLLLQNTDFCKAINDTINQSVNCPFYNDNMLVWWDNLKYKMKKLSQIYSKRRTNEQRQKYNRITNKLTRMYTLAAISPDSFDYNKIQELEEELSSLELEKCKGAILRSKVQWAIDSDKNTSYFLGLEKQRQSNNCIIELTDKNGNTYGDIESLLRIEHTFYKELYEYEEVDENAIEEILTHVKAKLENKDKRKCESPITIEEVKLSLCGMKKSKSPGNDGLTSEFYSFFFDKLGPCLLKVYESIEQKGEMSRSMKCGILSLIYKKKGDKRDLAKWRPISLLNVDYKILARCFSNRLKNVISTVVNKFQTCCIPGRTIHDNVANIRDIITLIESEDEEGYIIKLDQLKAFDRVSHKYLFSVLEHIGFGRQFVHWISIFYKNIISATKCNGYISPYFKVERSVRQGCPLSAMLYVLCAEPLFQISSAKLIDYGITIPLTETKSIMYQHADDSTITVSKYIALNEVLNIYDVYGKASGAKLNSAKSEILPVGKGVGNKSLHNSNLKIVYGTIEVLGVFLGPDRDKCALLNWTSNIEKSKSLLGWWRQRDLTLNGKAIVLNSLIMSRFWYILSTQPLPINIEKQIKCIIQTFLWDGKPSKIAYDTLIQRRSSGGLNIADITEKRDHFRMKYIMKYFSDDYSNIWKHCLRYFLTKYANMGLSEQVFTLKISKQYMTNVPEIYKELLVTWSKLESDIIIKSDEPHIYAQPLFLNTNITCKSKELYFKAFVDAGIVTVSDITYEVIPGFLSTDAICEIVQEKRDNLDVSDIKKNYSNLKECIPKHWIQYIADNPKCISEGENIYIVTKGVKVHVRDISMAMYKTILQHKDKQPQAITRWNEIYPNANFNLKFWKNVFLKEKTPDCIDIDFRIIHRIVFSMEKLYKFGKVPSDICLVCRIEKENFAHIFIHCSCLKTLHCELIKHIENLFRYADPQMLNKYDYHEILLFGLQSQIDNVNTFFLNILLSIARLCIYRRRFAVINSNARVDVVRLFRYATQKNIEYLINSRYQNILSKIFTNNPIIKLENNQVMFK